jgi:hypothetical protein
VNLLPNGFIILLLLILTAAGGGAGCKTFFPEKKPPVKIKIANDREINQNWQEITPPEPLKATAKMHVVALKLRDAAGWTDEKERRIRFKDGSETKIEIELIDEKGGVTTLFPNGFGEYVEFGKRAENKENPDEAYFQIGSRFTKIRLRSERSVKADEILWTEFEF